jgi:uncharacterized protein
MTDSQIVQKTADFVKEKFSSEGTGHDWWHMYRVWQLARHIAQKEGKVNMLIVELGALLHDIADWKFHDDPSAGAKETRDWLEKLKVDASIIDEVAFIVEHISYKGGFNKYQMRTLEGKIVQDADRLDALGAIGVARTFAFGGASGRAMYNPDIKPIEYKSLQQFKEKIPHNHTINHFYEKLLLLKDKMNTKTGKHIALGRHRYMEKFLQEFYAEWEGKI